MATIQWDDSTPLTNAEEHNLEERRTGFKLPELYTVPYTITDDPDDPAKAVVSLTDTIKRREVAPDVVENVISHNRMLSAVNGRIMSEVMLKDAAQAFMKEREAWTMAERTGGYVAADAVQQLKNMHEDFERRVYRSFAAILEDALLDCTKAMIANHNQTVRSLILEVSTLQEQINEMSRDLYEDSE